MSKTIHLLPIEPIEERYSADWRRWWPRALSKAGFEVGTYDGERLQGEGRGEAIQHGQFLDAVDTHYYKATQLAWFVKDIKAGGVKDGDVVLLLDGWNPAVTALAYIRDVTGIKFKIVLVLHAGTWDPHDHLSKCGMGRWAKHCEKGWLAAADAILLATEFHAEMLLNMRGHHLDLTDKIYVTGFPLELNELNAYKRAWADKDNMVVFPHRLAPEKQPEKFEELQRLYKERYPGERVKWVRTQDWYTNKESLYHTLARAKVAFSAALQETWGIVQLEAWYLGATPIVPDRCSYPEIYPDWFTYGDIVNAAKMVHGWLNTPEEGPRFEPARDPRKAWDPICQVLWNL